MPSIEYEEIDLNENARDEVPIEVEDTSDSQRRANRMTGVVSALAIAGSVLLLRGYIERNILYPVPVEISSPAPDPQDVANEPDISDIFSDKYRNPLGIEIQDYIHYEGQVNGGFVKYDLSVEKSLIKEPFEADFSQNIESLLNILNSRLGQQTAASFNNSYINLIYSISKDDSGDTREIADRSLIFSGFDITDEIRVPRNKVHQYNPSEKAILNELVRVYISSVVKIDPTDDLQITRYIRFWQTLQGYILPGKLYEEYLKSVGGDPDMSKEEYGLLTEIFKANPKAISEIDRLKTRHKNLN